MRARHGGATGLDCFHEFISIYHTVPAIPRSPSGRSRIRLNVCRICCAPCAARWPPARLPYVFLGAPSQYMSFILDDGP